MYSVLNDIVAESTDVTATNAETFDCPGSGPIAIDHFEVGPGWLPASRLRQTGLLIPLRGTEPRLSFTCNGRTSDLRLTSGWLAVVPPETMISARWREPLDILAIWIEPTKLRAFIEDELHTVAVHDVYDGALTMYDPELCALAQQIREPLGDGGFGREVILDGLSSVFLATLIRNHGLCEIETIAGDTRGVRLTQEKIRLIRSYIEENLSRQIRNAEIADIAGLSSTGLYREIKEIAGTSPAEFVQRTRIQCAHRQIRDTNLPLKQIAADCGFADQAHLSRTFKKYYGLSPKVFRRHGKNRGVTASAMPPPVRQQTHLRLLV